MGDLELHGRRLWHRVLLLLLACLAATAGGDVLRAAEEPSEEEAPNPFVIAMEGRLEKGKSARLGVRFDVPPEHHVYADSLRVAWGTQTLVTTMPKALEVEDRFSGKRRQVLEGRFTVGVEVPGERAPAGALKVTFQGCNASECFFPETREWRPLPGGGWAQEGEEGTGNGVPSGIARIRLSDGFRVASKATGYLGTDEFLAFLDRERGGELRTPEVPADGAAAMELGMTLGAIFLGGLLLNLTPCVLPMIPVNLAILGVGTGHRDRRRGFLLGSAYGAGMAVSYGLVGTVVVLTGARFGQLQSSVWFNLAIAVVFVLLSLAMFDRWSLDLSGLQGRGRPGGKAAGSVATALTMGGVSALLAGACVAPVVISVLVLATGSYQRGEWSGLFLPFLLGLGMALPWPFAGAGLSLLPKPGAWMTRVKQAFGVVILGFAAWYGWLAWGLLDTARTGGGGVAADVRILKNALEESRRTGVPVVIDFWASWCKNCSAMEHTTFEEPRVRHRLEEVRLVRFQAEHLGDAELEPILEEFGVLGLPTFVLLVPDRESPPGPQASLRTATARLGEPPP